MVVRDIKGKRIAKSRRRLLPEEVWIREYLRCYGYERETRFCPDELGGVSLTRVVEALLCGHLVHRDMADGDGAICTFEHDSDDGGAVQVRVHFVSNEGALTIVWARYTGELDGEPYHAA